MRANTRSFKRVAGARACPSDLLESSAGYQSCTWRFFFIVGFGFFRNEKFFLNW